MPDVKPMEDRDANINAFLVRAGWVGSVRTPLAGDASFRRYQRITKKGHCAMLMDAPPPLENVGPFVALSEHLRDLGFRAPEVLAEDAENGFLLLEDFGDVTYTRALAHGADEQTLYDLALDLLIELHGLPADQAIPGGLPRYDDEALLAEAYLLTDWYMPTILGGPTDPDVRQAYAEAWLKVFAALRDQPQTLVLRDYHVDNLMILPGQTGIAACGLLDFQDALAGPTAYDLMSLIEDARRDIDDALAAHLRRRYAEAFPDLDRDAFDAAFTVLAAQRHAKVIGIFTRLCLRDGKAVYLRHIPRIWRLLERALRHPALSPVANWFESHIPATKRGIPECQPAAVQ